MHYRNNVRQKNGGLFRFYILRTCDLGNARTVAKDRYKAQDPLPNTEIYDKEHWEKKKKHADALKRAKKSGIEPNLPAGYMKGEVTHLDVGKFKNAWDTKLSSHGLVSESRKHGVKFTKKHELRYALADFATKNGIAFCP